jgi:hypothetical protein
MGFFESGTLADYCVSQREENNPKQPVVMDEKSRKRAGHKIGTKQTFVPLYSPAVANYLNALVGRFASGGMLWSTIQ